MHRTRVPSRDDAESSTAVRALTGLLLGAAAGAVAALVAPRRPPADGEEEGPVPPPS